MATTWTATTTLSTSVGSLQGFSGNDGETGNTATVTTQLAFPANTNSGNFALNFNANSVQAIFMLATQNCTINTNNSTSPTNTLNLVAGIPMFWGRSAGYFANPFNANTNAGFLTCNAATILNVGVLTA
jgi:hypothetical protein